MPVETRQEFRCSAESLADFRYGGYELIRRSPYSPIVMAILNWSKPTMYRTPHGERILLGAERRLFEASLGMMADLLSDADCEFGVQAFDELQRGQKFFSLYRAGRALLRPDESPPELNAFLEGTVAAVYRHILDMVIQEIDEPEFAVADPSWRKLVVDAARQCVDIDDLPSETSCDKKEWDLVIECLMGAVLWDDDFAIQAHQDAEPQASRNLKQRMGISDTYYTAVPDDPRDDQLNLYMDALKGLTPRGRGESFEEEDSTDPTNDDFF